MMKRRSSTSIQKKRRTAVKSPTCANKQSASLGELGRWFDGEILKPIPEFNICDEEDVDRHLRRIASAANEGNIAGKLSDEVLSATEELYAAFVGDLGIGGRLSWMEVGTLLSNGIPYLQMYRFFVIPAKASGQAVGRSPCISLNYIRLLRYSIAVATHCEMSRANDKSNPNKTNVADTFEESSRGKKSLLAEIQEIAKKLPARYWVFLADLQWFAAFDDKGAFSSEFSEKLNRDVIDGLARICMQNCLALVGMHLVDGAVNREIIEIEVQRPVIDEDLNTAALWVRIPVYYKFGHVNADFSDFEKLKLNLGHWYKQPGRLRLGIMKQVIRNYRRQMEANGESRPVAWDMALSEAHRRYLWSESTMVARIGHRPKK